MKFIKLIFVCSVYLFAQESATGIIKPIYEGKLSVATDGMVEKIYLKEGDRVKKGQVVLKLNDKLQKLETRRRKLVLEDTTQIDSLKKNLKIMKEIVIKKEEYYNKTKAISLNELRQLKMQYYRNEGELESLKENKKKEKIEYEISSEVLQYYKLRSPVNGTITKIIPNIGEWVQAGKVILEIVSIDTCFVEVDLHSELIDKLPKNKKVQLEMKIGNQVKVKDAKIGFISNVADSSSGLIRAKIYFNNKDKVFKPGLTATVLF